MKFCFIKKVPFKTPEPKSRIMWANVIVESQGLAMVLVPKADRDGTHAIYFAEENPEERVFVSVTPFCIHLENEAVGEAGNRLRTLGKSFFNDDLLNQKRRRDWLDEL